MFDVIKKLLCVCFPGLPWMHGVYTRRGCWISRKQNRQATPVTTDKFVFLSVLSCVTIKQTAVLYYLDSVLLNFTVSIVSTIVAQSSATPLLPSTSHILSESLCKVMKWSSCLNSVQILMSSANDEAKRGSVCLGYILEADKVMKALWFSCLGLVMWGQWMNCLHCSLIVLLQMYGCCSHFKAEC